MGDLVKFPDRHRVLQTSSRWYERIVIAAAALGAGVGGTLLIQKATESEPPAQQRAEVRNDLQLASQNIGELALHGFGGGTKTVSGDTTTVNIRNSRGTMSVVMKHNDKNATD